MPMFRGRGGSRMDDLVGGIDASQDTYVYIHEICLAFELENK